MNKQHAEVLEFAVVMAREFPTVAHLSELLAELIRLSHRHAKLQEKACNVEVKDGHDAPCESKIRKVCEEIGCEATFSGDPRGCTVKVKLPSGRSNHWGGETWAVPQ